MYRREDPDKTPPGGFRWKVDATGKEFHGWTIIEITDKVSKYLDANDLPTPINLAELIEDYTCKENNGFGCKETDAIRGFIANLVLNWQVIKTGTLAIGSWFLKGLPTVSQEAADIRSAVCRYCSFNVDPRGCAPCQTSALHTLVNSLVGDKRSAHHEQIKACSRCGCSLQVKVWVPLEHLTKTPPVLPLPEWCWITKEKSHG